MSSQNKEAAESSHKLPDVIDQTVAADSLKEYTATLVKAFRHCLSSLADSLYSQSIIPEDAHRKAQRESLDEDERSRALVSCVEARLEIKPSDFKKFVDILKRDPFLSTLGSKIVKKYCTLSSVPITKCPNSSPAVSQYAAYLKRVYRNSPISPDSKWPPTPSKKYIKLATVEHGYKCRDKFIGDTLYGNIEEVLKSRKEISVDEILIPEGMAYLKLVLIEGAPGIGKSTLAWELCRRWEQGCLENYYGLTVLLRLREKEVQEIRSIAELFHFSQSKYKDVLLDEVSSSNGKGVLFILDGFDELPTILQKEGFLVDLIKGILLPESTVLVTSRPSATAELLTICRPQLQKHIEILGFTQERVEEYASSIFSSEPKNLQRFKAFISASKNPAINSLMYVPLNAAIIVEIYRNSKSDHLLPHTLTQVYTQLCLTILKRYLQNNSPSTEVNRFKDLPDHLYKKFLKLSEVAFDGMMRQEVIYHNLPSDLVHFGFLDAVSPLYGGGNVSYNFLHLTLQEFFAAYHISQLSGDARLEVLRECGSDKHWNVVWRFVVGLTEFKFFEGHVNSDLFVKEIKDNEVQVTPLFIQCLFEANIKMDRLKFFGHRIIAIETLGIEAPLYCYALGYCIANLTSEVFWNLKLEGNNHTIDNIVHGLKTSKVNDSNNVIRLYVSLFLDQFSFHDFKFFPLRGIIYLDLNRCFFASPDHLTTLLPLMTSLKRLDVSRCTFPDFQCINEFLQQLSQTNVTSLNIKNVDITKCISALQLLIDPLTGTLEELCVGFNTRTSEPDYPSPENILSLLYTLLYCDTALLDVVCAPSSLKYLALVHPRDISSLTQLQSNTNLTALKIVWYRELFNELFNNDGKVPPQLLEIILGILEHNQTLEHLIVGQFVLSIESNFLKDVAEVLSRNSTLKSIVIQIDDGELEDEYAFSELEYGPLSEYMKENYPEISDPRITWT